MRPCPLNETPVTGSARSGSKPLKIGDIEIATPVFLAPMSGVTDSPVRRLAAELGAGLVVSEMTASDELANGHRMSRLRSEARLGELDGGKRGALPLRRGRDVCARRSPSPKPGDTIALAEAAAYFGTGVTVPRRPRALGAPATSGSTTTRTRCSTAPQLVWLEAPSNPFLTIPTSKARPPRIRTRSSSMPTVATHDPCSRGRSSTARTSSCTAPRSNLAGHRRRASRRDRLPRRGDGGRDPAPPVPRARPASSPRPMPRGCSYAA